MRLRLYLHTFIASLFNPNTWRSIVYGFTFLLGNFLLVTNLPGQATFTSSASGAWNVVSTWTLVGTDTDSIPDLDDIVIISTNNNISIPAGYVATCSNLNIGTLLVGSKETLTFATATTSLIVSGNVTIFGPVGNNTREILVNAGTLNIGGNLELGTGQNNIQATRISKLNITTGTVNVAGNLTFNNVLASNPLQTQIIMSSGAGVFNLAGSFTINNNSGTLTAGASSTFNYNSTASGQTIPIGVSNIIYNNLSINNTSTSGATLSAAISATNVSGNLDIQTGTLNNGGFAINLASGKNLTVAYGAVINLSGVSAMPTVSGGGTKTFGATSVTNYNGLAQIVSAETYGNLILSGSGLNFKTFVGSSTIQGNLSISGTAVALIPIGTNSTALSLTLGGINQTTGSWGGTISAAINQSLTWFGSTTTGILNVNSSCVAGTWLGTFNSNWNDAGNWCGGIPIATTDVNIPASAPFQPQMNSVIGLVRNLTIEDLASLTMTGSSNLIVSGNWNINGIFNPGTGSTITMSGISQQIITCAYFSTFENLIINNVAGVLLENNITVGGTLTFINGKVTTGSYSLIISNSSPAAIVGATLLNYVNGNLQRSILAGANTYSYAIGTDMGYAPVYIAFTSGTIAGTLTGFTTNNDHPFIGSTTLAPLSSVNRFWTFTINSGLTTANYGATYHWLSIDQDVLLDFNSTIVGKYNAPSSWVYPTVGTHTPTSIQILGVSGFSDFQVGNGCSDYVATFSGDDSFCPGSSGNVSVSIFGGVSPYTVVYTGGSGGTITGYIDGTDIPVNPVETTTYTLTSVKDARGCNATLFGDAYVTMTPYLPGTWLGITNTDWNTASNWCGGVPTATTDVFISSQPGNQPTINTSGALTKNITIDSGAVLTIAGSNTLYVSGDWIKYGTFVGNNSTVIFDGSALGNTISGTAVAFNNLTISNTSGIVSGIDFSVNGILNLQSANPTSSSGTLAMGMNILTLDSLANTIGIGDVSGIVKRTFFVAAVSYSFGNQYTTVTFQNIGTLPTEVGIKITIGSSPAWKSNAIHRGFEVIQSGALGSMATVSLRYLDNELNGNLENKLVYWYNYYPFAPGSEVELGRANYNEAQNWIGISGIPFEFLPTGFGQIEATLGNSNLPNATWNGSLSTSWAEAPNWTPLGVPSDLTDVIIPDAATTNFDPILLYRATSIGRLTIESGGILNANPVSLFTIAGGSGAWNNNGGTFNADFGNVIFTNAMATISGETDFYDLTIETGAGLVLGSNTTMRIAGTLTNNGILSVNLNPDTYVEYNGGNQIILNPNSTSPGYHNLILSGNGTKTMPSTAVLINGDFSMAEAAITTANAVMTIEGGFTLGSGTSFTTGAFNHAIAGNFTNEGGIFVSVGSNIEFGGTNPQTIGGSAVTAFNTITINNVAGIFLANNVIVNGTLAFESGIIKTGINTLSIANPATTSILGASAMKYVNGNLMRTISAGSNTYSYPIGTASAYAPVSITFTAGTIAGTLTGYTSNGDHYDIGSSTLAPLSSVNRNWKFTINSGLTTVNYGATYNWIEADQDELFEYNSAEVGKCITAPNWTYPLYGMQAPTSIAISGATSFGYFQVANGCEDIAATLSGDTSICSESIGNLYVTIFGGRSPYTVEYTGDGGEIITGYVSDAIIQVTPLVNTTYTLTSVKDAGGCFATLFGDAFVTMTLKPSGTWQGTTNTEWNTASNWCGGVPTFATDVIINSDHANQPVVNAPGGMARSITLGTGAVLTIAGSGTLTVSSN